MTPRLPFRLHIVVLVLIVLVPFQSWAEDKNERWMKAGLNEISPSITFQRELGTTVFSPRISYGNFPNDFTEGEVEAQLVVGKAGPIDFSTFGLLGGASVYYNKGQSVLPFIGLRMGMILASGSIDDTAIASTDRSFVLAPKAGFIVPISQHVAFKAQFEFQYWRGSLLDGTRHYSIPLGLAFYWE